LIMLGAAGFEPTTSTVIRRNTAGHEPFPGSLGPHGFYIYQ
jgi:hypothetical protein